MKLTRDARLSAPSDVALLRQKYRDRLPRRRGRARAATATPDFGGLRE